MERRMKQPGWARLFGWVLMLAVGGLACGDGGETLTDPDPDPDTNRAPVAAVGSDRTVSALLPVRLDGTASTDPDGDALTYAWTLTPPTGSSAVLDDATSATPIFTPDVAGDYTAALTVSDGEANSPEATAVITAEDNSVALAVEAATGGTIESSDGLLTLEVPAGALTEDTEIRITRAAAEQFPEALAGLPEQGVTVYDLQPSGLQFSTPALVSFTLENAVSETAEGVVVRPAILLAESEGVVEVLSDVTTVVSESSPTSVTVRGGLSHFSSLPVVESRGPVRFQVTIPYETVNVDESFGVSFEVYHDASEDGLGGTFLAASGQDTSEPPVRPTGTAEIFFDLPENGVAPAVHAAVCEEVGEHIWSGQVIAHMSYEVPVEVGPGEFEPYVDLEMEFQAPVTCTQPVDLDVQEVSIFRAGILKAAFSGDEILFGTNVVEKWNPGTGERTQLGGDFGSQVLAIHEAGPGGTPFAVSLSGRPTWYGDGTWIPVAGAQQQDQGTQVSRSANGSLYRTTAIGDAQIIEEDAETGGLVARSLGLEKTVAFAGDEAQTFGVSYLGDNTTFSVSRFWSADADGQNRNEYEEVLDVTLDEWQQNEKSLACLGFAQGKYVCLFTVGERSPGFMTDGQPGRIGFMRLIIIDTEQGTAEVLESSANPVVGAQIFSALGMLVVAWADQLDETMEFREVRTDGSVGWTLSQPISPWCSGIRAFAVTSTGERAAASCTGFDADAAPKLMSLRIPYSMGSN